MSESLKMVQPINCNKHLTFFLFSANDLISYSPEGSDVESHVSEGEEEPPQQINGYRSKSEIFLQNENCLITSPSIAQCHECENDPMTKNYLCRFFEYRKIERNNGKHRVAGFLDPHIDPTVADLDLWTVPDKKLHIDRESADYILRYIANDFCELAENELSVSKCEANIAWKRSVLQVREICDVCDTSLFNLHWTCTHCGTCVCLECYKERRAGISRLKPKTKADKEERDHLFWLKCNQSKNHALMLTQMTTCDALMSLNRGLHKICDERNITQICGCTLRSKNCLKMESKRLILENSPNKASEQELRLVMKQQRHKTKQAMARRLSLIENEKLNHTVKHTFTSNTQILTIIEPSESPDCYKLFQNHWEKGKPVVVSNVTRKMNKYIWSPEYFSNRFGHEKHVLVNCENGTLIHRVAMKHFWDGFLSVKKRLPLESEQKVVLKLKDWPTSDDFATLKEHFEDIMSAVPLAAYTNRDGKFNMARYLPNHFSRPDLGPKMYSAYSQMHPSKQGSTNLHLDVSDAINVMVHVSKPIDAHLAPNQYSIDAIHLALEAAGADTNDKNLLFQKEKLPGAIWHIFPAHQADDMRKVLYAVARENGKPLGVNDDPIHDQNWFIDEKLRKRLRENGVNSYTIIQYEGDAVFIPAGAPHQVLNVLDCIKVALDFVAPENITECLNLTDEFRILSTRHQNREDKLQIKNILYHTIKNLVPIELDT